MCQTIEQATRRLAECEELERIAALNFAETQRRTQQARENLRLLQAKHKLEQAKSAGQSDLPICRQCFQHALISIIVVEMDRQGRIDQMTKEQMLNGEWYCAACRWRGRPHPRLTEEAETLTAPPEASDSPR